MRHAAFGEDVVPDVNWMLIISDGLSTSCTFPFSFSISLDWLPKREEKDVVALKSVFGAASDEDGKVEEVLSTKTTDFKLRTAFEVRMSELRLCTKSLRRGTFERAGL